MYDVHLDYFLFALSCYRYKTDSAHLQLQIFITNNSLYNKGIKSRDKILTCEYCCYWNLDHENCKSLIGNLPIKYTHNVIDFVKAAMSKLANNKLLTLRK